MNKLLIAAAVAALAPAAAQAQDLSGAWKLNLNIADMMIPLTCTFTQMGGTLGGTCDGADGKPAAVTGTVDGTKLKWSYDTTFQDMPMHVAYAGEVKPDSTIGGTVEATGASGTFTGTK
jgi:hypothetical protein